MGLRVLICLPTFRAIGLAGSQERQARRRVTRSLAQAQSKPPHRRRAVGARRQDILLQFLLEAVTLTVTGGLIGVVGGFFSGWILTRIAAKFLGTITFQPSLTSVVLALAMAIGTGLLFGIYPARRASMLSPMEAIRYE